MTLNYEHKNSSITITGPEKERKKFLKTLCETMNSGAYEQIREEIGKLETIIEPIQFTFGAHHKIYFNKEEIIYYPNTNGEKAKTFWYEIFCQKLLTIPKEKRYE